MAYTFGPRNDATCRELLALLDPFSIGMVTSDDQGSYAREVPKEKHLTGKIFTQRIERNNLSLHTRIKRLARKTICCSCFVEIHEKVIGSFIEKYMFYLLEALSTCYASDSFSPRTGTVCPRQSSFIFWLHK